MASHRNDDWCGVAYLCGTLVISRCPCDGYLWQLNAMELFEREVLCGGDGGSIKGLIIGRLSQSILVCSFCSPPMGPLLHTRCSLSRGVYLIYNRHLMIILVSSNLTYALWRFPWPNCTAEEISSWVLNTINNSFMAPRDFPLIGSYPSSHRRIIREFLSGVLNNWLLMDFSIVSKAVYHSNGHFFLNTRSWWFDQRGSITPSFLGYIFDRCPNYLV